MRTDEKRPCAKQPMVVQASQRGKCLTIHRSETGACQQTNSGNCGVRGGNPLAEGFDCRRHRRIIGFSQIRFVATSKRIGKTVYPELRASFIGSLCEGSGSTDEGLALFGRGATELCKEQG